MDKKLKAKWVKALRSGGFKQTTDTLYKEREDAYCCLGVLCRMAGASVNEISGVTMPTHTRFAHIIDPVVAGKLADLNDDCEMPFEMIAGFVQENL